MKKILFSALALCAMSTVAMAEPVKMTESRMDQVTAGYWRPNVNVQVAVQNNIAIAAFGGVAINYGNVNGNVSFRH